MSKRFRILAVTFPHGLSYVKQNFLREENIELTTTKLKKVEAIVDTGKVDIKVSGKAVTDYDFVWIQTSRNTKDIAYMLSLFLDSKEIPHTRTDLEISKLVDLFTLAINDVSIPKTYFCDQGSIMNSVLIIEKELGYPYVIKPTIGLRGLDIHFIRKVSDLIDAIPKLSKHKKYVFQKFIPNDFDYRILVGNGKVLSGGKSTRTTDAFRNNARLGSIEEFLDIDKIPKEVKALALRACEVSDIEWSGLDIVTDKTTGESYVLEMNRCPGLTKGSSEVEAAMTYLKSLRDKTI